MREIKEVVKRELRIDDIQQFEEDVPTFTFVEDLVNVNNASEGLIMLNDKNEVITKKDGKLLKQVVENNIVKFTEIKGV